MSSLVFCCPASRSVAADLSPGSLPSDPFQAKDWMIVSMFAQAYTPPAPASQRMSNSNKAKDQRRRLGCSGFGGSSGCCGGMDSNDMGLS
jgi:hypothetical protein